MIEVAVTDSHPLIWYALSRWHQLGSSARKVYERADEGSVAIYVPTVALVEIFEAAHRGTFRPPHGASQWAERLFSSGNFFPVDLTVEIVLHAESLYAIPERGDRLVAATAAHMDVPLLTRDAEIADAAGVRVVW